MANVFNPKAVDAFIERVIRAEHKEDHIGNWYRSTFRSWILNDASRHQMCLSERDSRSPLLSLLVEVCKVAAPQLLPKTEFHFLKTAELPEWAVAALDAHELVFWLRPREEEANQFQHWQDYMYSLPKRQIRHTVEDMKAAVRRADALARRAQILGSLGGVEHIEFEFSDPEIYLVRLETKGSFQRESHMMDHCVGRSNRYYDARKANPIYSLRCVSADTKANLTRTDSVLAVDGGLPPLATIEVSLGTRLVVQQRGFLDRPISREIQALLDEWYASAKITRQRFLKKPLPCDEDEEQEDEYDEGDDEDDGEEYEDDQAIEDDLDFAENDGEGDQCAADDD